MNIGYSIFVRVKLLAGFVGKLVFMSIVFFFKIFPSLHVNFEISDQERRSLFCNNTNILHTAIPNKDNICIPAQGTHIKETASIYSLLSCAFGQLLCPCSVFKKFFNYKMVFSKKFVGLLESASL